MSDTAAIDPILRAPAERGEVPGVVAAFGNRDGLRYEAAFGRRDISQAAPMTADSVFWIASMTKAIVSAAAMQLVEQGRVGLDETLGDRLPALAAPQVLEGWDAAGKPRLRPARGAITLRRLLTHTSGFSYDFWNPDITRYMAEHDIPGVISCQRAALATPLVADPGTRWEYGIGIDWAGLLVEAISGQTLAAYLQDHVFAPLGMTDTGFLLRRDQRDRLAAMHARLPDGSLAPIPFEVPQQPEFHMGGGGLYGTARDYLAFTRMILNHGRADGGAPVLRPETVAMMGQNHIGEIAVTELVSVHPQTSNNAEFYPGMAKKWSLGFMLNTEAAADGRSANSLAWAGLANTYYWIDPTRGLSGVILTQILPFADPTVLGMFAAFEAAAYRSVAPAARVA